MTLRTAAGCLRRLLFAMIAAAPVQAQDTARRVTVSTYIVGAKETVLVTVAYNRTAALGREVLGDLVPLNKPWITGSGDATELSCPRPFVLGDLRIPAGTYALWTLPTPSGVTLIVSRDRSSQYDPRADAGRVALVTDTVSETVDRLTIGFHSQRRAPDTLTVQYDVRQSAAMHGEHLTMGVGSGTANALVIIWGKFRWTVPVTLQ
jgi:Protein of unknown function (DUF2911)